MANSRLVRWGDAIPVLICLLLAGVLLVVQLSSDAGAMLCVQTPDGEQTLSLSENTQQTLVGADGHTLMIAIEDGRACVLQADCPDQVCVRTGWLSRHGDTAACLPAGILLYVEAEGAQAPDAVAR